MKSKGSELAIQLFKDNLRLPTEKLEFMRPIEERRHNPYTEAMLNTDTKVYQRERAEYLKTQESSK